VKIGLGTFLPEKAVVSAYMMEELKAVGVDPHTLPNEFYDECYKFANTMAIAYRSPTRMARRLVLADTVKMLARLVDLWLKNPADPTFTSFHPSGGYKGMFEKYRFTRLSEK
jgi:hypothetical protein